MDELLTVEEVAKELRFSNSQIYTMLRNKILPCIRVGVGRGSVRIKKKDFDAYIAKQSEVNSESEN